MPTTPKEPEWTDFEKAKQDAASRTKPHHVEAIHRIDGWTYVVRPGPERT